MKIAMVGHKRVPGREGGIEVVVEELVTRMAALGHNVTVYNRHKKGYKAPKLYKDVKIIEVPTIEKKSMDAVIYSFVASIMVLFGGYDVIHYHAIGPSFFLLIPHFFRKKTVVTVHGLNYKTPKWKGFGAWFIKKGEKITAKYADSIIVLSKEQQKYFQEKYHRETVYIPNGTTIFSKEKPEIIQEKYKLEKDNFLLYLSRIVPGKGLEYLLDAYREVEGKMPLVVAGGSEYSDKFYQMIKEKARKDERVKLVGFVDGKELRELYSNARLFIFPSEAEGMPMCMLEAMSYDCPCLVSNIPENLEVGGEYVLSFETQNIQDLRKKIKMCLDNPQLFKNGSREYIREKYCWSVIVNQTLSCYTEAIKSHLN